MKFKTSLIVILVSLMITNGAFAAEFVKKRVGKWNVAANWDAMPNGASETKIRYAGTICTLDSVENWAYTTMNEMRVYNSGVLNIVPGGSLTGPGWLRVGAGDPGTVNQSGGTLNLKEGPSTSKLVIGDEGGSNGLYDMTGGTLTYTTGDGQLIIGDRGGTGKLIISGTAPVILMKSFYVGGVATDRGANGTLQYNITAGGVSPIHCTLYTKLDLGGASSTANLIVSGCPTNTSVPIVLVENTGTLAVIGKFDHLNGGDANEGVSIVLGSHPYTLTYMYDSGSGKVGSARDGTYNDIALIPQTSITIPTPATNSGDLLIAAVATDEDTSALISAPDGQGWTLIDRGTSSGAVTLAVWQKMAGSSEPLSYTFTWNGSDNTGPSEQAYGWMMRFSGQDATNPINVSQFYNDSSSTPTSPAVNTTVNNCLILRLGAFDDNSITVGNPGLTGHTAITMDKSSSSAPSGVVSGGAGYVKQAAIGGSGPSNFSLTAVKSARTLTIAIAPANTGTSVCCEDDVTP
jgi:hypothetical protein